MVYCTHTGEGFHKLKDPTVGACPTNPRAFWCIEEVLIPLKYQFGWSHSPLWTFLLHLYIYIYIYTGPISGDISIQIRHQTHSSCLIHATKQAPRCRLWVPDVWWQTTTYTAARLPWASPNPLLPQNNRNRLWLTSTSLLLIPNSTSYCMWLMAANISPAYHY